MEGYGVGNVTQGPHLPDQPEKNVCRKGLCLGKK